MLNLLSYLIFRAGHRGWSEAFYSVATTEEAISNLRILAQQRVTLLADGARLEGGKLVNLAVRGSTRLVDMDGITQPPRGLGRHTYDPDAGTPWNTPLCFLWGTAQEGNQTVYYRRAVEMRCIPRSSWTGNPGLQVTWQEPWRTKIYTYLNLLCNGHLQLEPNITLAGSITPPTLLSTPYGELANTKSTPRLQVSSVAVTSRQPPVTLITVPGSPVTAGQQVHLYGFQGGYRTLNGTHLALANSGGGAVYIPQLPGSSPGKYLLATAQQENLKIVPFTSGGMISLHKRDTSHHWYKASFQLNKPGQRYFDPCGTVMDWIRIGKLSQMRLFADNPKLYDAVWYFALPHAELFHTWHVFGNSDWFPRDRRESPGDYNRHPRQVYNNLAPALLRGHHYCGPLAMYQGRSLFSAPPPLLEQGFMDQSICCMPDQDENVDMGVWMDAIVTPTLGRVELDVSRRENMEMDAVLQPHPG